MKDEEREELKKAVQEAVKEILAGQRPMPVPAPLAQGTEIIIRSGVPQGLVSSLTSCPCPIPEVSVSLSAKSKKLLKRIKDEIGEKPEDVIAKLELQIRSRLLDAEILEYAKNLEIESE